MARIVSIGVGCCIAAALLGGCTFILPFDEKDIADAGIGAKADASVVSADGGVIDSSVSFDVIDVPTPTGEFDAAGIQCPVATGDHWYCGSDGLVAYTGSPDDLVHCAEGKAVKALHCPHKCLAFPNGFPDQCDSCDNKKDGDYCGDEILEWDAAAGTGAKEFATCMSGVSKVHAACDGGCTNNVCE